VEGVIDPIGDVAGLHWQVSFRSPNGGDAFAVRIPSMTAVIIGFHGHERQVEDGHLHLHVGTAHRLIFLGDPARVVRGHFIDCRKDSATRCHRISLEFHPDSARILCIPAGVAHAFTGLEGLFVVDEPALFLPDVSSLVRDGLQTRTGDDARSVAVTCPDDRLPVVEQHGHAASEKLYEFLGEELRRGSLATRGFPLGEMVGRNDVVDAHRAGADRTPDWEPLAGISGAGWQRNLVLTSRTSAGSGVIVMNEPGVRQVVDHGIHPYEHGAYGIHVSLEDRLTFLGDGDRVARATLVDCREGSPTLHARIDVEFRPSPFRQLIIPPGVGHALQGLSGIFTINRAKPYLDRHGRYPADQRTVEWPLDRSDYPVVPPHDGEPPRALIRHLVDGERALLRQDHPSALPAASIASTVKLPASHTA
jgi:dTDP-4-dehydrorhamnose 3,5-epimerase-like enzyme